MKEAGYEVTQEEGSIEGKGGGVKRWKKEQKVYKGREEKARRDQQVSEKKKEGESVVQEKEEKEKELVQQLQHHTDDHREVQTTLHLLTTLIKLTYH